VIPPEPTYFDIFLRLIIATVLGGLIGYERESSHHYAGFRTHMLVAVSAALVGVGSAMLFYMFDAAPSMDPLRIAANVISGIGFLGAGAILKHGSSIRGLTTAASLWGIAAVGLFTGLGVIIPSIMATIIVYLALTLARYSDRLIKNKGLISLQIHAKDQIGQVGEIGNILASFKINIKGINIESLEDDEVLYHLLLSGIDPRNGERISQLITSLEIVHGVKKINLE